MSRYFFLLLIFTSLLQTSSSELCTSLKETMEEGIRNINTWADIARMDMQDLCWLSWSHYEECNAELQTRFRLLISSGVRMTRMYYDEFCQDSILQKVRNGKERCREAKRLVAIDNDELEYDIQKLTESGVYYCHKCQSKDSEQKCLNLSRSIADELFPEASAGISDMSSLICM